VKKLAQLIEKYRVTLMIATPTFLRGYLRGVNREALASIKLCVTGAEKLPSDRRRRLRDPLWQTRARRLRPH
jgi:acyl-coenzyme A synthetase/AMP-(fatty) acid ligase